MDRSGRISNYAGAVDEVLHEAVRSGEGLSQSDFQLGPLQQVVGPDPMRIRVDARPAGHLESLRITPGEQEGTVSRKPLGDAAADAGGRARDKRVAQHRLSLALHQPPQIARRHDRRKLFRSHRDPVVFQDHADDGKSAQRVPFLQAGEHSVARERLPRLESLFQLLEKSLERIDLLEVEDLTEVQITNRQ